MRAGRERERGAARRRGRRAEAAAGEERAETGAPAERAGRAGAGKSSPPREVGGTAAAAGVERATSARRNGAARTGGLPTVERVDEPVVVGGHAMIDLDFLRGLIDAVDASGIDSIEIARAGTRIRISKTPPPPPLVAGSAALTAPVEVGVVPAAAAPARTPAAPLPAAGEALEAPASEPAPRTDLVEVKSPMVGTFYRAPAPEAPPYVEVGSHVTKGQTLCILEAMKLMNELESEVDGVVREVLVENTEPVEFGQVLFRIEPTKR